MIRRGLLVVALGLATPDIGIVTLLGLVLVVAGLVSWCLGFATAVVDRERAERARRRDARIARMEREIMQLDVTVRAREARTQAVNVRPSLSGSGYP